MPDFLSERLGSLRSFEQTSSGFLGKTTHGQFRVTVYSEFVIRVAITAQASIEDFSYAVVAQPTYKHSGIRETDDSIHVETPSLKLQIVRAPVSFIFRNADGVLLNEDDAGLGTSWIGDQVTTYKKLQEGERFIGLGEKTGPLDRRGSGYQNWNTDAYGYHSGSDPLYCTLPFYIGLHHQVQYGIFFDNTHKSFFNFGASNNRFSSFSADQGEMNYYFISGKNVAALVEQYTWLTGRTPLPPKWSIGYQQCRYSYYPDSEVYNVARNFREKKIPADAIVLDIHYMDKYKIFTWDKTNFSNPKKLIEDLGQQNFQVVLMCDPGIKEEKGYPPYDDGVINGVFVKYPDGQHYTGQVWPGWCHFPDFTNPKTRAWWKGHLRSYAELGVNGYWNDMNEIATWGHMLPENLEFDFDGVKATSRRARNVYGLQMARSTYEATKDLLHGNRPFNLTRSAYSGVQRYAAVWTGDNVSYDEHMMLGVRLVNSLGITGVAFSGYDVGGFVGEAGTKLFARWISIGAFSPFFRGHTMINTKDSEPWSYGEEVESIARNYIRFRYQLLPYIYSLFYEASTSGMPVQRSLAIDHAHDARVFNGQFQHQYLFGPSILVAPVESSKEFAKIFLPPGTWYALYDGQTYDGDREVIVESPLHKLPVFIRESAIIPMQSPVQSTRDHVDELLLHVYFGNVDASFLFYEDDGQSYDYESGKFAKRMIRFEPLSSSIKIEKKDGTYSTGLKTVQLMLHGFSALTEILVNGRSTSVEAVTQSFFLPLEKYDPINEPESMGSEKIQVAHFPYITDTIDIAWK